MKEEFIDRETSSLVVPVLISGVVGAGLALLLTPKSGREIRGDIGRFARRRGGEAAEAAEEAKSAVNEAVQTGQESLAETREELLSTAPAETEERSYLAPVLISGLIGAAAALLFAPKSGKEVMGDIRDLASTAVEKGKDWYEQSAAAVKEAMEKGKEAASETKEKLKPAA